MRGCTKSGVNQTDTCGTFESIGSIAKRVLRNAAAVRSELAVDRHSAMAYRMAVRKKTERKPNGKNYRCSR